jgi:hypothetical protein
MYKRRRNVVGASPSANLETAQHEAAQSNTLTILITEVIRDHRIQSRRRRGDGPRGQRWRI